MNQDGFSLDQLKNVELNGYLIFTDATETSENRDGIVIMSNNTRPGVDEALMNAGFNFTGDGSSSKGMYWMKKTEKENLRYHPIRDKDMPLIETALAQGMKTRIDFFCRQKSSMAYDAVNELLKLGYKILLFSPQSRIIGALFLVKPGEGVGAEISEVK